MATPEWKPGLSRSMARPVGLPSVARGERSGGPPSLALNSPRALVDILRRRVPGAKDGKDGLPSVARGERGDSPPSLPYISPRALVDILRRRVPGAKDGTATGTRT